MSWNRGDGLRGLRPLTAYGILERCPAPLNEDITVHWGGPWDVEFTGPPAGVSCNFCHKTWLTDGLCLPEEVIESTNSTLDIAALPSPPPPQSEA